MWIAGPARKALVAVLLAACTTFPALAYEREGLSAERSEAGTSADAREMGRWVRESGDNRRRPYAIMDKKAARLVIYDAQGRVVGAAPALIGLAPGDHAIPGIGQRALADIQPHERTTPAGRFPSEPGRNITGETVVWVDYDAGFAIHRVRPGPARERREQRLASATPADNRVSLGCIVVDGGFFDTVVAPTLGHGRGVVYVLPETRPVRELIGTMMASQRQDPAQRRLAAN